MKFKVKTRFNDFTNSSCLHPHLRDLVHNCIVKRVSISRSLSERIRFNRTVRRASVKASVLPDRPDCQLFLDVQVSHHFTKIG